jgi:KaiC/GvpD/RAD55 family RecA-like ATPase
MEERIRTYVKGLDERMEGGIPKGHLVLICGRAGTMKSTLSFSILFNQAKMKRARGIYLTLEQSRVSLLEHMVRLGLDPRTLPETLIIVIDMTRLRKENQLKVTGQDINWLDSLAALYSLSQFKNPRSDIYFLFEKLRELGMTIIVISEMLEPDKQLFGMFGVEDFLADGIIHLDMEREERKVNLFLSVVKMRKCQHDRAYFPLIATKEGFEIVTD